MFLLFFYLLFFYDFFLSFFFFNQAFEIKKFESWSEYSITFERHPEKSKYLSKIWSILIFKKKFQYFYFWNKIALSVLLFFLAFLNSSKKATLQQIRNIKPHFKSSLIAYIYTGLPIKDETSGPIVRNLFLLFLTLL